MIVCHCNVVSHREIDRAIECGARDECTIAALCGAGTRCGGCVSEVQARLRSAGHAVDEALDRRAFRRLAASPEPAPAVA